VKRLAFLCAVLLLTVAGFVRPAFAAAGQSASNAASAVGVLTGDPTAWWIGLPLLVVVLLIGAYVLRRDRRRGTVLTIVGAAVLVLGITIVRARYAPGAADMASMQSVSGGAPIPVTIAIVGGSMSVGTSIDVPANVAPFLEQDIVARAPGLLTDFSVYVGDHVRAGQIVARLDEPELQSGADAAAANARAAAANAASAFSTEVAAQSEASAKRAQASYWQTEIARERYLYTQGAVSAQEYQNERAQSEAARAAYASASANVSGAQALTASATAMTAAAQADANGKAILAGYASVIVPYDGIVMKRLVDPGAVVAAGTPVLRVAVVDRLRVQAQVAQVDLAGITIGTPLDVRFDDGSITHGRVTSISPVLDPNTRTALVEAVVSNAAGKYQPGGFVRAIVHPTQGMDRDITTVPSVAIVGGASPAVWIDRDGSAHRIDVTVVSDDGQTADVRGALRAGMHVVVDGAANLEEGDAIVEASP
jgi:multidrug efflux pump subunit AcrA (membrane-fusion protein)